MAYEQRIESLAVEATAEALDSSQDALKRGAARRRTGTARGARVSSGVAESRTASPASLNPVPVARALVVPARDNLDDSLWRARFESELKSVRASLVGFEAGLTSARATGEEGSIRAAEQSRAELRILEGRLEQVEEQISRVAHEVRSKAHDNERQAAEELTGHPRRLEGLERSVGVLAEQQAALAHELAALSQSLVARRMRTTTLYLGGLAIALISAAVWLFTKAAISL
jgi:hypothetical protein